jgi:hypothetical protein
MTKLLCFSQNLALAEKLFLKYSYTKFHDSLTDGLIADTKLQTEKWADMFCT